MEKVRYLGYQTIQHMLNLKRRYFLYLISFYVGLLLPVLCIGSYQFIDSSLDSYAFDKTKDTAIIDWFSQSFETANLDIPNEYSIKVRYQDTFLNWDNVTFSIEGKDEKGMNAISNIKGRRITEEEVKQASPVVLVSDEGAEKNQWQIGDIIQINNYKLEIVGVIETDIQNYMVMPLGTMEKVYTDKQVNMQYTGTIMLQENENAEQLARLVTSDIKEKDEKSEILSSTIGAEVYRQYIDSVKKWKVLRAGLALGATIFFLINEIIIIIGKMNKDERTIGIKMALGTSIYEVGICYMIEIVVITLLADLLVFLTMKPLIKLLSLESIVIFNKEVVFVTLIGSIATSGIIALMATRNLKKHTISSMLKTEGA